MSPLTRETPSSRHMCPLCSANTKTHLYEFLLQRRFSIGNAAHHISCLGQNWGLEERGKRVSWGYLLLKGLPLEGFPSLCVTKYSSNLPLEIVQVLGKEQIQSLPACLSQHSCGGTGNWQGMNNALSCCSNRDFPDAESSRVRPGLLCCSKQVTEQPTSAAH